MNNDIMRGEITEADFEEDILVLKMQHPYYAKAGTFMLVPYEERYIDALEAVPECESSAAE